MATKKLKYKNNLALFISCLSLLVFGGCAIYENGGITYTSLIASATKVIPYVLIMYILGWLLGSIIESSKSVKNPKNLGYANSLLEDILKEEGLDDIENNEELEDINIESVE